MKDEIRLNTPLSDEDVEKLIIGDRVLLNGIVYTARDAAHKRLVEAIKKGKSLPFNPQGQIIYYAGPAPAKPGRAVGPIGPTTSCRMDPYAIFLIEAGIKGMIGKGSRSEEVKEAMKRCKAVYFAAIGGAAALLSQYIKGAEIIAYEDLGTEAIYKLAVEDFPVIVAGDVGGGDLYEEGKRQYRI
ncbi:MAG TPA: Fe-S-containing hydro-lyase [Candidatus Aerophobetes bacterium]|nr:Fe-S-containing hydro-lyase [Candidatus Aerophobetes bacterium]